MPRKSLIAANWKMNPPPEGFDAVDSPYRGTDSKDVFVFPPFPYLSVCVKMGLMTGAQCAHPEDIGAHTGAVSMAMIKHVGCDFVLCGHSERRKECNETDAMVAAEAASALDHGIHPIVCVGETAEERAAGKQEDVVKNQLSAILPLFSRAPRDAELSAVTIAYEPVWAIGTGNTAEPVDIVAMHVLIRSLLPDFAKQSTRILYGGSVNAANAQSILTLDDVDGALVGGASLKPEEFKKIVEEAK